MEFDDYYDGSKLGGDAFANLRNESPFVSKAM